MRGRAVHLDHETLRSLHAGDRADGDFGGLQHGTLFDMGLDIGRRRDRFTAPRQVGRGAQRPRKRPAEGNSVGVDRVLEPLQRRRARKHHRAHAARIETAALLVGPGDELDRAPGGGPGVVQRLDRLQPGDHAVDAVEPAPARLAVHVAAGQHRRQIGFRARPADEQIRRLVHGHRITPPPRPVDQQLARRDVFLRQRLPVDAVARDGADLRHLHQPAPKPAAVDPPRDTVELAHRASHRATPL